ncbi:MAG: DUF47 family protein [Magnetococcales bacterium]|nr:DUF47 family protein [Magnetococcales bacterium]
MPVAAVRSLLSSTVQRMLPHRPHHLDLLMEQCELAVETMDVLADYMHDGDPAKAERIHELERKGEMMRFRHATSLTGLYTKPRGREDFIRAIRALDGVMDYCRSTVHEMEDLGVDPDEHAQVMARHLREGVDALRRGILALKEHPELIGAEVQLAMKVQRAVDKCHQRAISELLPPGSEEHFFGAGSDSPPQLARISAAIKRRELYRHLSHTAGHIGRVGQVLRHLAMQAT